MRLVKSLILSIATVLSTSSFAMAQISSEFTPPSSTTDPFSTTNTNSGNPFPSTSQANSPGNSFTTGVTQTGFPSLPTNPNQNTSNKWNFQSAQTGFTSTNISGNGFNGNTTSFFNNNNSGFGNNNVGDCGVTGYFEGVGGNDKTSSQNPSPVNINSNGVSLRAGVKLSSQKCINTKKLLDIEKQKILGSSSVINTCAVGMTNPEATQSYIDYCNKILEKMSN